MTGLFLELALRVILILSLFLEQQLLKTNARTLQSQLEQLQKTLEATAQSLQEAQLGESKAEAELGNEKAMRVASAVRGAAEFCAAKTGRSSPGASISDRAASISASRLRGAPSGASSPIDSTVVRSAPPEPPLSADLAALSKERDYSRPNTVVRSTLIGQVVDRDVLLVDDIIDTAGSVVAAVDELKEHGARDIVIACAHPLLSGPAWEQLASVADRARDFSYSCS